MSRAEPLFIGAYSLSPISIHGLDEVDQELINDHITELDYVRNSNLASQAYYDMKNHSHNIAIAVSDKMYSRIGSVVGWPAKAVDSLARLMIFNNFRSISDNNEFADFANRVFLHNRLDVELQMGVKSGLIACTAFLVTTTDKYGKPFLSFSSAASSHAKYDYETKRIGSFFKVLDYNKTDRAITSFVLMRPYYFLTCVSGPGGWKVNVSENKLGYVPVEHIPYKPSLDRPFGRTKISREVKYLTDAGARAMVRTESAAEIYNHPLRWIAGLLDEQFKDPDGEERMPLRTAMGDVWKLPPAEIGDNGALPAVGQFPQVMQQPHTDTFRLVAARFSSAADVPLNELGVVDDNPSSADAIRASARPQVLDAEQYINYSLAPALKRSIITAYRLEADPVDTNLDLEMDLVASFRSPQMPTPEQGADFATKLVSINPAAAGTAIPYEMMGLRSDEVEHLLRVRQEQIDMEASQERQLAILGGANLGNAADTGTPGEQGLTDNAGEEPFE